MRSLLVHTCLSLHLFKTNFQRTLFFLLYSKKLHIYEFIQKIAFLHYHIKISQKFNGDLVRNDFIFLKRIIVHSTIKFYMWKMYSYLITFKVLNLWPQNFIGMCVNTNLKKSESRMNIHIIYHPVNKFNYEWNFVSASTFSKS